MSKDLRVFGYPEERRCWECGNFGYGIIVGDLNPDVQERGICFKCIKKIIQFYNEIKIK